MKIYTNFLILGLLLSMTGLSVCMKDSQQAADPVSNIMEDEPMTALWTMAITVTKGNLDDMREIIEKNSLDICYKDPRGFGPLMYLTIYNEISNEQFKKIAAYFISEGAEIHPSIWIQEISPERLKILLSLNPKLVNQRDSRGFTPIMSVALCGKLAILSLLLESHGDIHALCPDGMSALWYAANTVADDVCARNMIMLLFNVGARPLVPFLDTQEPAQKKVANRLFASLREMLIVYATEGETQRVQELLGFMKLIKKHVPNQ